MSSLSSSSPATAPSSTLFTPVVYSEETRKNWGKLLPSAALQASPAGCVALVVTSATPAIYPDGQRTGFHLKELNDAFEAFLSAGYHCVVVSESGSTGADEKSVGEMATRHDKKVWGDKSHPLHERLAHIQSAAALLPVAKAFSGIYSAGGHGCEYEFPHGAPQLKALAAAIYEQGGAVGLVCHAPSLLQGLALSSGVPLARGKKCTGFSASLEDKMIPGLLEQWRQAGIPTVEEAARSAGGAWEEGASKMGEYVVGDQRLFTGMNPASATKLAKEMIAYMDALRKIGVGSGKIDLEAVAGKKQADAAITHPGALGDKNAIMSGATLLINQDRDSTNYTASGKAV